MEKLTNAKRFINCYNRIDVVLRSLYNFKKNLNFSDCVRRAAGMNMLVKKYEDDIIDYARLRNSIVHRSTDETIAEPHDDVVEHFESIVRQITTPPTAMSTIANRKVFSVQTTTKLKEVLIELYKSGYSVVPVYEDKTLVGVITRKMLVDAFGESAYAAVSADTLLEMTVEDALDVREISEHYEVVPETITIDNLLYIFQQNKKLSVVILTKDGSYHNSPLGIIVTADTIDMQTILDNY